jgi:nitroimidazol reductase NimA-like FMN-containing flavoprotein (pyridoxamine 5'-phosphate oxidase superfamily)
MIAMSETEIFALLDAALIGRLAMADLQGRPYAIPLPFCRIDSAIYVRVPMTGRKGEILSVNNNVCFEIDVFTDQLDDYASILVEGCLVAVNDLVEKARVRQVNDAKYNTLRHAWRPGHGRRTALADLPTRKIIPTSISGRKMSPREVPVPAALLGQGAESSE